MKNPHCPHFFTLALKKILIDQLAPGPRDPTALHPPVERHRHRKHSMDAQCSCSGHRKPWGSQTSYFSALQHVNPTPRGLGGVTPQRPGGQRNWPFLVAESSGNPNVLCVHRTTQDKLQALLLAQVTVIITNLKPAWCIITDPEVLMGASGGQRARR